MPAPKSKPASGNGTAKAKGSKKSPTSTRASTPLPPKTVEEHDPVSSSGRPDKAAFDADQQRIKSEIDTLQLKLSAVKEKMSLASKAGPGNDKRNALRAELDGIRGQQSNNKNSRSKTLDQLKALQEGIQTKVKDLQAAKGKTPFKTVADVEAYINNLEKQVESGSMKLAEEKRALVEINQAKRSRRAVESFQADQDAIEADRQKADELRKQLDDPEAKAISERYDTIKAELDELKKDADDAYAGRNKLFEERDALQAQVNDLFNEKRDSAQQYREANDRYWNKLNEDRARRAERARVQRAAEEAQKKLEIAERILEEAAIPAYQAQIEDAQTLINYFSGKSTGNVVLSSSSLPARADVEGVLKLEIRKVEAAPEDVVVRKKKGEDQESYFVGKAKVKGSKKGGNRATALDAEPSNGQLQVPLAILSALLSLSIPPPASTADVPRVVEDLKTKKAWFEANQARVTAENIAKAEAKVQQLIKGTRADTQTETAVKVTPPNGEAEAEPTPAVAGNNDEVDKLDDVGEDAEISQ